MNQDKILKECKADTRIGMIRPTSGLAILADSSRFYLEKSED